MLEDNNPKQNKPPNEFTPDNVSCVVAIIGGCIIMLLIWTPFIWSCTLKR